VSIVPDYRLFHVSTDGDAVDVEEFFATSDETALNFAVTRTGSHGGELWCWSDRRFIALITRGAAGSR
jgi:hypothetical protein